jgi:hypothetical protein
VNVDQISSKEQEDDLNSLVNARQPQFCLNWKTTYIFLNWKTTSIFLMEDDLHFEVNEKIKDKLGLNCAKFSSSWGQLRFEVAFH